MKTPQRAILIALIAVAIASVILAILYDTSRWLTTAGILLDLAGIIQLEISGLFEKIAAEYGDHEKYPYGPPSHITRELIEIENPDTPARSMIRSHLYYEPRTGFYLLVTGFALQLVANWV